MKKAVLLLSVATTAVLTPTGALAQEAPASGNTAASVDEEVIIVTARRRAEDVSKVPIAITAFSGEQLVTKGVTDTVGLTKITPGLNIAVGTSETSPFIVMRGQSRTVTGNGFAGVVVYLNDVPLPNFGSVIPTYDLENIQALKGPQGTLFGRNSIGGAILTVTKAPTYNFEGYARAEVEQYGTYRLEGAINIPIVEDRVALRLAAQVGHQGGDLASYVYGPYSIDLTGPAPVFIPGELQPARKGHGIGELGKQSYRATLLIEPTDWIKNVTVGDYTKNRGNSPVVFAKDSGQGLFSLPQDFIFSILGGTDPTATDPRNQFAALYAYNIIGSLAQCQDAAGNDGPLNCNYNTALLANANAGKDRVAFATQDPWKSFVIIKGVTNTTTIRLGDNHQLKNIFGYRVTETLTSNSLTSMPIPIINATSRTNLRQKTEELQLSGSFLNNNLQYTIGGFYLKEEPNGNGGYYTLDLNAFFGLSSSISTTYLYNTSKAIYGQVDYSFDDFIPGLTVTAGLRQTWDKQSACAGSLVKSLFIPGQLINDVEDVDTYAPTEEACRTGVGLPGDGFGNVTTSQIFPAAKFKKLTYTFGANWEISPDAMVYVTHRRGYRAGAYNTPLFDPYLAASQTFGPETLEDWEVGTKLRFRTGDVSGALNVAVFTGKDTDNQLALNTSNLANGVCIPDALGTPGHETQNCTDPGGVPGSLVPMLSATPTATLAGGSLTIRGFEVDGAISPFRGLTITGNVSHVDISVNGTPSVEPRLADFLARAGKPVEVAIQGQPKWIYGAGVVVEVPGEVLGGELSFSADYHHTGSFRIVQLDVPSYDQVDVRAHLDNIGNSGVSAAAWVKNLTDEVIYNGTSSSSLSLGAQSYGVSLGRTFGMSLSYRFGN